MSLSSYAEIISKAFEEKNWNYVSENSADEKYSLGLILSQKSTKLFIAR